MLTLKKRKGFTMWELLIVIGMIAVLWAFAVPNSQGADNASRYSATDNDAKVIRDAVLVYMASSRTGNPPADLGQLVSGLTADQSKNKTATGSLVLKTAWTSDPATFKDAWDNAFVYDSSAGTITSNCNGLYDPIVYSFK